MATSAGAAPPRGKAGPARGRPPRAPPVPAPPRPGADPEAPLRAEPGDQPGQGPAGPDSDDDVRGVRRLLVELRGARDIAPRADRGRTAERQDRGSFPSRPQSLDHVLDAPVQG